MQLPRFLLQQSFTLRDILQTLNITKVFEDDADIIEMGTKGPHLTQVTSCCLLLCLTCIFYFESVFLNFSF